MLTETVKWRWSKWVLILVLIQCLTFVQGEIYINKRMAVVTTFPSSLNTVCVVPLSARPKVALKIDLMVISGVTHDIVKAGFVNIRNKLLSPIHSQHKLTVQHIVDDATLHILKVQFDGVEVEFVQSQDYDWTDFYQFHHIALGLRGTADISPCEHPTTQHPARRPSTPSTTTAPPSPTTTERATKEPPTFFPYGAFENEVPSGRHFEEYTTTTPPTSEEAPDEDDVIYLREPFDPLGEEPIYTNLSRNETYDDGESDSDVKESDDDEPWWRRLVYILGDYKRIPLLLIFLIVFCVGAGMGSVATIICEQHCCCRNEGHHSNKSSDYDGEDEFRHFSRTDFTRPSANATFVGAVDGSINSGRLSKENISHPLPPGGSRSPGSETYHTPYHHQQRYLSNGADETLPLNMPLPQDNQRVKNGAYNQFNKYQDTYQ